jgi:hypothetical protein
VPLAWVRGIREGHFFFGHGPRELHGSVEPDAAGLARVELRLERRHRGICQAYDARRERLRRIHCGAAHAPWFHAGNQPLFSYLLPFALPRGRYVLDVRALDRVGRTDRRLQRGRNRVTFYVA